MLLKFGSQEVAVPLVLLKAAMRFLVVAAVDGYEVPTRVDGGARYREGFDSAVAVRVPGGGRRCRVVLLKAAMRFLVMEPLTVVKYPPA